MPPDVGILFPGDIQSLVKAIDEFFSKKFNREKIKQHALNKYSEKNADVIFSDFNLIESKKH